ncbi:MAG: hypothetical protein LBP35_04210 [Candidatus Ancillula trichonymphae]|nr:hypothetical protein [Candidatus Ancillula trichonymphae]
MSNGALSTLVVDTKVVVKRGLGSSAVYADAHLGDEVVVAPGDAVEVIVTNTFSNPSSINVHIPSITFVARQCATATPKLPRTACMRNRRVSLHWIRRPSIIPANS